MDYYPDGRIMNINRMGWNGIGDFMDILSYTYTNVSGTTYPSQKLQSITELGSTTEGFTKVNPATTATYEYSASGQLTTDPYKNINLSYNSYLELLESVSNSQTNVPQSLGCVKWYRGW